MPSTYSDRLRLELMATGEKSNTWGTITNTNLGTLLEEAIGGYVSVAHTDAANYTLTTANGASDEARNMVVNVTGALTASRNLIVPNQEKLYIVRNSTTGGFDINVGTGGGGGTTVLVKPGASKFMLCDGANNIREAVTEIGGVSATFTNTNPGPALKVTHSGTGNALLVEDTASTDSTPFLIDADNRVVNGHTAALQLKNSSGTAITPNIQQVGATSSTAAIAVFGHDSTAASLNLATSGNASIGSHTAPADGVTVGYITAQASDGDEFHRVGAITFAVEGTAGNGDTPGRITFATTPDGGSTSPTEAMRINNAQDVGIGRTAPVYTLDVAQQLRVSQSTYDNDLTGTDTAQNGLTIWNGNASGGGVVRIGTQISGATPPDIEFYKCEGGNVTNTKLRAESGDGLGRIKFHGLDRNQASSGAWVEGARIEAIVNDTPSAGVVPAYLRFMTMDSGGSLGEVVRIGSAGLVGIGTTDPARKLDVMQENSAQDTQIICARFGRRSTGGVGQIGIGSGIEFAFENGSSSMVSGAQILNESTNVTAAAEDADIVFRVMKDGTIGSGTEALRLVGNSLGATFGGAIAAAGSITSSGGVIGYGSGAGGTVTQLTSKSTGVTLNALTGTITMHNASLAANTAVTFTLTNSFITNTDFIMVQHESAGTVGAYVVNTVNPGAGSVNITVRNLTAGALGEAIVLRFMVFNSVNG